MLHRSRSSEWLIAVLIAVLLAMVIRLYFYAPYRVYGSSMFPTLQGDELLIVNKWIYGQRFPSYGDIIVFHTEEDRDFIKRVIGLSGDRIRVDAHGVTINGARAHEPYVTTPGGPTASFVVPPRAVVLAQLLALFSLAPLLRLARFLLCLRGRTRARASRPCGCAAVQHDVRATRRALRGGLRHDRGGRRRRREAVGRARVGSRSRSRVAHIPGDGDRGGGRRRGRDVRGGCAG